MLLLIAAAMQASAFTVTLLFTDTRYAEMTRVVADDSYRLARRSPHNLLDRSRLSIYVTREMNCSYFAPYDCVRSDRAYESFQSFLLMRLQTLRALLEYPSANVTGYLMLDSDVALRRNIADRLDRSTHDVMFQREVPCAIGACVNGGVWWARVGSESTLRFVRTAIYMMKKLNLPDQDAFDVAIRDVPALRVAYLPVDRYPNGFVYEANTRLLTSRVHLVHANWCSFDEKARRLRQAAMARRFLPLINNSNQTFLCQQLEALDLQNLASVFACSSAKRCRRMVSDRCAH